MATKEGLRMKRAARRSTARLRAHQAWSWKFRSHLVRWKWMMRPVLLSLSDHPVLSEQPSTEACSFLPVPAEGNQRKQQTRKRTSERWPHPISLGSSCFSPLVGELWLRDSLNDQDLATFRTGGWL